MNKRSTNWAGNYTYHARELYTPKTVEDVRKVVKSSESVTALGTAHSFNGIADNTATQISLQHLDQMLLDTKSQTVTVGAGVKYGEVVPYLDGHGYALHNLASLPHISVAGACATATHGSGDRNSNLAAAVSGLEIVTADGEVVTLSRERDDERFLGAVVGLGGLGVVTKLTLDVQPAFSMRQTVYENLSLSHLEHHFDEIFSSGDSVSLFTDWQNHRATQVWIKQRVQPGTPSQMASDFFGAKSAARKLHPLPGQPVENCTDQLGIPGPWYERMPHFRMEFIPSGGEELQTEYFIPRAKAYQAILAVEQLSDQIGPHLFVTELRTVASDDLWLSPCYQRAAMTIHFTWKPEWPAVKELLPRIEAQLAPFDPRPHWAKLFALPPARVQAGYEKLDDFKALLKQYDPKGKFRNEFLNTNLYNG
jgi:alditol oxidase